MASRNQILNLYKGMLKEANKFTDFNFRSYTIRRIRDGFKDSKSLTEGSEISEKLSLAKKSLDLIKRQATIGTLFDINQPLTIEKMRK